MKHIPVMLLHSIFPLTSLTTEPQLRQCPLTNSAFIHPLISHLSQELSREGKDHVQGREVASSSLIAHTTY